jgi:hypothetical protein
MEAAQRTAAPAAVPSEPVFADDELRRYLEKAVAAYLAHPVPAVHEIAASLNAIVTDLAEQAKHLEDLERRLTTLEEKAVAILRSTQSDDDLYAIRSALDRELKPYRGKMSADQLSMLERRYLDTAILARAQLPRLSLFYLIS